MQGHTEDNLSLQSPSVKERGSPGGGDEGPGGGGADSFYGSGTEIPPLPAPLPIFKPDMNMVRFTIFTLMLLDF